LSKGGDIKYDIVKIIKRMHKGIEKQIFDYLAKHLKPERLEHSYNVAILAVDLASIYNVNILKAQIAGLLHDCAKYMTNKELVNFFKKNNKTLGYFDELIKFSPYLLHSFAGEIIARKKFEIKDRDILNAVRNHTLGRKDMSVLEKIIFVADSVSYDRKWKNVKRVRDSARKDLDKTFLKVLAGKIGYVINNGMFLYSQTVETWNWYVLNNKKDS